ncbi:hypothetical protein [uncultured Williamsia sp.]|uniref:hypothetical protein n=1 Tax=uncultured Williamsia sp. TaxID=259311 RepID=UPI002627AA5F|nr:hypothetical protein [uncultured Williamsia sp.]
MATDDEKDAVDDTTATSTEASADETTAEATTESTGKPSSDTTPTTPEKKADDRPADAAQPSRRPRLLVGALAALVVVLAVVAGVAVYFASSYRDDYTTLRDANSGAQRAQDVASDYAVKAALINYRDFDPWFAALRTNVDDKMRQQFTTSESVLRQLLGQLQWVSKGDLVGSDIKSQNNGVYVVQVFVDVQVTNVQSPGGVKTTALYPITVDKNKNWTITDISGGVAPLAQATPPN